MGQTCLGSVDPDGFITDGLRYGSSRNELTGLALIIKSELFLIYCLLINTKFTPVNELGKDSGLFES